MKKIFIISIFLLASSVVQADKKNGMKHRKMSKYEKLQKLEMKLQEMNPEQFTAMLEMKADKYKEKYKMYKELYNQMKRKKKKETMMKALQDKMQKEAKTMKKAPRRARKS